jgi:hypothetical protein
MVAKKKEVKKVKEVKKAAKKPIKRVSRKITEKSLLPANFHKDSWWASQYGSFSMEARDEAAAKLYKAMTPAQREELKETGRMTITCAKKHKFSITPKYAGTSTIGCISLAREAGYGSHAPTTVGDFLLTVMLQFRFECKCRYAFLNG